MTVIITNAFNYKIEHDTHVHHNHVTRLFVFCDSWKPFL